MSPHRYSTIGDELFAAGRFDEAMSAYRQALAASPRDAQARMGLDAILERARTAQPNAQLRTLLLEAYADDGANWGAVGWPADNDLQRLADDPLLHALLRKSVNGDADLERKLLALRKAVAAAEPSPQVSELIVSLAEQAWLNE